MHLFFQFYVSVCYDRCYLYEIWIFILLLLLRWPTQTVLLIKSCILNVLVCIILYSLVFLKEFLAVRPISDKIAAFGTKRNLKKSRQKKTIYCGLSAGGIICIYLFRNDVGRNVTVNDCRYRAMITDSLMSEIGDRKPGDIWFQQDGTTFHI